MTFVRYVRMKNRIRGITDRNRRLNAAHKHECDSRQRRLVKGNTLQGKPERPTPVGIGLGINQLPICAHG